MGKIKRTVNFRYREKQEKIENEKHKSKSAELEKTNEIKEEQVKFHFA
ncbi:MAG: hypothetical protein ACI4TX_04555 [Christensenellales bacterium]